MSLEYPYGRLGGSPCISAPSYSGTAVASLRLAARARACARPSSGCAVSGPLGSMFGKHEQGRSAGLCQRGRDRLGRHAAATRRRPRPRACRRKPTSCSRAWPSSMCSQRGSKEISSPWENPSSGARGTVTPIASAYSQGWRAPAATSWPATCAGRAPKPGCRAKPAAPSRAPGRSRACGPGRGPDRSSSSLQSSRSAPHIVGLRAGPAANSRGRTNFFGVARMRDPYEILGVQKNATPAAIKSAFRRLAKKLHPDANKTDKTAATKFSELNAAYEIVGDEAKRKAFDRGEIDAEAPGPDRLARGARRRARATATATPRPPCSPPPAASSAGPLVATDRGLMRLDQLGDVNGPRWQDADLLRPRPTRDLGRRPSSSSTASSPPAGSPPPPATPSGHARASDQGRGPETGEWVWKRFADIQPATWCRWRWANWSASPVR